MDHEQPDSPAANDGHGEAPPPVPRWVKQLAVALLVLAVAAILVMLLIGGEHGPGRHSSMGTEESTVTVAASSS